MATNKSSDGLERVHCNHCRSKTLHRRLKRSIDNGSAEVETVGEVWWTNTSDMLECCGCKEVVLRNTHVFSENMEGEESFFPPPVSRHPPDWRYQLPHPVRTLLEEVYRSLDADSRALPMMGARTLVDMLMADKVGDIGSFAAKLKELEKQGFISTKNREVLEAALDAGSAAAHRGYSPTTKEVHAVMDIVENLLQAVYVLGALAKRLKIATPPRPRRKRTAQRKTASQAQHFSG